jgi:hypothetical protein
MEDSRQDLRSEYRGGDGVVGFGLPAALRLAQVGRIWPCISRDVIRVPRIVKARAAGAAVSACGAGGPDGRGR